MEVTQPDGRQVGLTFVTDNAVHIKGDFNPHSSDGTTAGCQSARGNLPSGLRTTDFTFANFYGGRTTLDTADFANLAVDHWRPAEILADAVYIESNNFIDGAVSDTFVSTGGETSSYTNQPRPVGAVRLQIGFKKNPDVETPVWVDRNGTYYHIDADDDIVSFFDEFDANNAWTEFKMVKTL